MQYCAASERSAPRGWQLKAWERSTPCWNSSPRGSIPWRRRPRQMRSPEFWNEAPSPLGSFVAGLLAPVGAAVDAAGRLRRAVVRPYRAPALVICVGNLVAGGSGKTPVVLSLAATLAQRG